MKLFKSDNQQNYSTAELEKLNYTAFANLPRAYKSPEKRDLDLDAAKKRLTNLRRIPLRQL